jgi:hypothetical protein
VQFLSCVEAKDLFGDAPEEKKLPPDQLDTLDALVVKHTSDISGDEVKSLVDYFDKNSNRLDCIHYSLRELIANLHGTSDLRVSAGRLAWAVRPDNKGWNYDL